MSKDLFKELKESIKDSKVRWDKIETLTKQMNNPLSEPSIEEEITCITQLLTALVEHLKPLYGTQDAQPDIDTILQKMQTALKVGKK